MFIKLQVDELDVGTTSKVIDLLLNYLKETQNKNASDVTMETGMTNLSKARRYHIYQQKKINGLKLNEMLYSLLTHYRTEVYFDTVKNTYIFESLSSIEKHEEKNNDFHHYYYYYYSHWNNSVCCASLTLSNNFTRAQVMYYDSEGTPVYQSGKGRAWKTGASLFIYLPNSRPEHVSLVCLYIGNNRSLKELEWITGTYAGTRLRDDAPVCGIILLNKFSTSNSEITDLNIKKDQVPEAVIQLLTHKRMGVLPVIPFSEKDLAKIIQELA
ncbi:MAG TPA: hypothetical protein PK239_05520 [Chitinophagales bacterium]|nr:hypothetical protein [Chitinophagales bacterium]HRK26735.1 hypothetical protein [Chitinophagales bacterium]